MEVSVIVHDVVLCLLILMAIISLFKMAARLLVISSMTMLSRVLVVSMDTAVVAMIATMLIVVAVSIVMAIMIMPVITNLRTSAMVLALAWLVSAVAIT